MPRLPIIIFDETVVAGTVLLLTPRLKSAAFAPFENNPTEVERSSQKSSVQPRA
jgi:hypothetical protein